MRLKIGFMSNQEMSEWSGVSVNTLSKKKKEWAAKQLSQYAVYELQRGGFNILSIIEPIYRTPAKDQVSKLFDECWGSPKNKLDRCKNASEKIYRAMKNPKVKEETVYSYTCEEKRTRYGVPKKRGGTHGDSRWVFCKIVNGRYEFFTPEEEAIKKELMKKYLASREEQVLEMRAAKLSYESKEITKEEYQEIIDTILTTDTGWNQFVKHFEDAIGYRTDFATLLEERAWVVQEGKFEL